MILSQQMIFRGIGDLKNLLFLMRGSSVGRASSQPYQCTSHCVSDGSGDGHDGGRVVQIPPAQPIKRFGIRWNEPLGNSKCPYMHRYMINLWLFSIRVHVWHRSDDKRFLHNHPFNFLTIVLKGGYTDVQEGKTDVLSRGSVRFRKASHLHYVAWPNDPTITLLICGPKKQNWGFKVNGRIMRPLRFFSRYGHPPCDEL